MLKRFTGLLISLGGLAVAASVVWAFFNALDDSVPNRARWACGLLVVSFLTMFGMLLQELTKTQNELHHLKDRLRRD